MKQCSRCKRILPEFNFNKRGKAGLRSQCRECDHDTLKAWREKNKAREKAQAKIYRETHKEKRQRQWAHWYAKNKERVAKNRKARPQPPRDAEKERLRGKIYREKHRGAVRASKARYRESHRQELRIQGRIYCRTAREKIRQTKRKYEQTSHGLAVRRVIRERRRARETTALGSLTAAEWNGICERHNWQCYLCGTPLTPKTALIEHRIPLSRGGTNHPSNIAPACNPCNLAKHIKTEEEYRTDQEAGGHHVTNGRAKLDPSELL